MEPITSVKNPKIKLVRALHRRKTRNEERLFVVEGIRHVGEALEAGAAMAYLCYAPDQLTSEFARELVAAAREQGIPCFPTSGEVFAAIADREGPQGILAVVHQRADRLEVLAPAAFPWGVAVVSPQDPGNLGAILRTVDAVGASGVLALEGGVDPYHPTAVRASMGALFWHPVVQVAFPAFVGWAANHGYHVYGSSAQGGADYRSVAYQKPAILLLGSERAGLTEAQRGICEETLRLPMAGRATSLNLAVAAGVLLYAMRDAFQQFSREGPG